MTTSHRRNSCPGVETLHIFLFGERRWGREEKGERKEKKKKKKKVSLLSASSEAFSGVAARRMAGGICSVTGRFVVLILQRRASAVAVSELSVAVPGQVTPFESDN